MSDLRVDAIEFRVIGELKSDPGHLLLSGDDGHWYDYHISSGAIVPVDPSDSWAVDLVDASGRPVTAPEFPTPLPSGRVPYLHNLTRI